MTLRWPALSAVLSAVFLTLAACAGESEAPHARPEAAVTGERLLVRPRMVADLKPVAGVVTTRDMGEARARIGGTLVRLDVREGDVVRKGQVIGLVADQRLRLETSAYDAQAAAAAAEAERARAELKRVRTLFDKGIYARARLEQAEAAARGADGMLQAARAQRAASAESSAQGAILAPASGRVLHADVPAGAVVSPGQSIATVTAGETVVRLETPEAQADALRVGATIDLVAGDLPGAPPTGTILQVYPAVAGGRVVADIAVAGLRTDLVGQRVRLRVRVGERSALVLPSRFVSRRYGLDFVRLQTGARRSSEVAVQIAPGPTAGEVEVLSGLADGDTVIAARPAR